MEVNLIEMEGVKYLIDESNKRIAIQISYEKYGNLVDDLLDRLIIESRRNEESYPIKEVIEELEKTGNLDKYVQA